MERIHSALFSARAERQRDFPVISLSFFRRLVIGIRQGEKGKKEFVVSHRQRGELVFALSFSCLAPVAVAVEGQITTTL